MNEADLESALGKTDFSQALWGSFVDLEQSFLGVVGVLLATVMFGRGALRKKG